MAPRLLTTTLRAVTGLGMGAALLLAPLAGAAGAAGSTAPAVTTGPALSAAPLSTTALPGTALPRTALPGTLAAPTGPGRENLMACFQSSREARLLILMDESGSLRTADPENGRILAAEYAINDLSRRAAQKDATFRVAVRGFADDFEANDTWLTLPADRQRAVDLVRSFADRNRGAGTDYWMALNGARAALAEADTTGSECQAMVWFSDGELDPTPTFDSAGSTLVKPYLGAQSGATREQAAEAAKADLCRDGGVADQVRSAGVTTFGVALGSANASREAFSTMEAIAAGTSEDGSSCGARTEPAPGEFFFSDGSDGLLSACDSIFALDEIQTDSPPTNICQGDAPGCDGTMFVLDSSIQHVHIFATSDVATPQVSLLPPSGTPISVPWGKDNETTEITVGGGDLTVTGLTDNSIALDMSATGAEPWTGAWAIRFVDPAAASAGQQVKMRISISGGLVPTATIMGDGGEAETVRKGDQASITLGILDRMDAPVAPESLLGSVQMDVGLVTQDGAVIPVKDNVTKEEIGTPLSVDLSEAEVGNAQVRLRLRVVTAPTKVGETDVPGTALAEAVNNIPFRLLLAADYPVAASAIDFGSTEEITTLPGSLTVTGPGCVWVDPGTAEFSAVPGEVGTPRLSSEHTSAETCLTVADGAEAQLPVQLAIDSTGNGGIAGTMTAYVAPEGEATRAEAVPVRLAGSIARAANPVTKWALFAGVLAAGVLIPLALLYLTKWRSSFIPARALFYEIIPVDVTDDRVLRNGQDFAKQPGDLRSMVPIPPKGARALNIEGTSLKASSGISPMGIGQTLVTVPGAQVITSENTETDKKGCGTLPLAIHNSWSAWSSPSGARVLILTGADLGEPDRQKLYADVAERLPRAFSRLDESFKPNGSSAGPGAGDAGSAGGGAAGAGAAVGATGAAVAGGEWDDWGSDTGAAATTAAAPGDEWGDWGGDTSHSGTGHSDDWGSSSAVGATATTASFDATPPPAEPLSDRTVETPFEPSGHGAASSSAVGTTAAAHESAPASAGGEGSGPDDWGSNDWGSWDDGSAPSSGASSSAAPSFDAPSAIEPTNSQPTNGQTTNTQPMDTQTTHTQPANNDSAESQPTSSESAGSESSQSSSDDPGADDWGSDDWGSWDET